VWPIKVGPGEHDLIRADPGSATWPMPAGAHKALLLNHLADVSPVRTRHRTR
jgi:hypothetical protein